MAGSPFFRHDAASPDAAAPHADGAHPGDPVAADPRRTQRADLVRSLPIGLLAPLEASVVLTIAIRQFDASNVLKGVIAMASGVGLVLSPWVTQLARRSARPAMTVASGVMVVGCVGFVVALSGSLWMLALGAIVGIAAQSSIHPLLTATYEYNFAPGERGCRVGRGLTVKVAVAALAGLGYGALLAQDAARWRVVVAVGALACAAVAACQMSMPSAPLIRVGNRPGRSDRPWPHFHLIAQDRKLRLTLMAWMVMGFGNLMLLPLRVEYLAVEDYGIGADPARITLLTVTIPAVVRLICLTPFGVLFDRMSFFAARIAVNVLFALAVAAFFSGSSDAGLVGGAVALGVATAGGDLMWSLWVTKFAPPGRVADYMGLHTFFTGVRAVLAPLVAFLLVERVALQSIAWMAMTMMLASAAMLVPEFRSERRNLEHAEGGV